jgi:hypothetical protein
MPVLGGYEAPGQTESTARLVAYAAQHAAALDTIRTLPLLAAHMAKLQAVGMRAMGVGRATVSPQRAARAELAPRRPRVPCGCSGPERIAYARGPAGLNVVVCGGSCPPRRRRGRCRVVFPAPRPAQPHVHALAPVSYRCRTHLSSVAPATQTASAAAITKRFITLERAPA